MSKLLKRIKQAKKHWLKSKTILVNLATALLVVVEAKLSLLQPHLRAELYAWIAFLLPLVNTALRFVTSASVTLKKDVKACSPE